MAATKAGSPPPEVLNQVIQEARLAFEEDTKYIEDILRAGRLRHEKNLHKEVECSNTSSGGITGEGTI